MATQAAPTGTTTWKIDPTHAAVGFSVKHMMISTVKGRFGAFDGAGETDAEGRLTRVWMAIQTASIDTGVADRDNHLRSGDFFDAAAHPEMRFESTAITQSGNDVTIEGVLTIRGVSKPVTLRGECSSPVKDPWGMQRGALEVSGKISRKAWGLEWNMALEAGGVIVSDEVKLQVEVEAVAA